MPERKPSATRISPSLRRPWLSCCRSEGLMQLLPRQEPFLDEELPERAPHRGRGRGGFRLRLRRRLDLDAVLLGERARERERGDRSGLDEDLADEPAAPLLLGQRPLELVLGQQAFRHEERSKRLPGIRGIHLSPYRRQRGETRVPKDLVAVERGDRRRSAVDAELFVDVLEVLADGARGDPDRLGDLGVRLPGCDELEDLALAVGERRRDPLLLEKAARRRPGGRRSDCSSPSTRSGSGLGPAAARRSQPTISSGRPLR